eukprot:scaffold2331_cov252-Pinguiococcus_pyrenoidosus.AAC.13
MSDFIAGGRSKCKLEHAQNAYKGSLLPRNTVKGSRSLLVPERIQEDDDNGHVVGGATPERQIC